ncbi:MAG: DUF4860 domain-containing protein [Oscillospiraceae bacterium]
MKKTSHSVLDIFFTLALFCVFSATALAVVVIGADVYRKTTKSMEDNFNGLTATSYITQKLHQNDAENAVSIGKIEDIPSLIISQSNADQSFCTYIYEYDGNLQEQLVIDNTKPSLSGGQSIVAINSLDIVAINDKAIQIDIVDTQKNKKTMLIAFRSSQKVGEKND